MFSLSKIGIAVSIVLVASGCSSSITKSGGRQPFVTSSDPAMMQLASVAQNLHERTAVHDQILTERYQIKEEARIPLDHLPATLRQLKSYSGGTQLPLETVLKELALEAGLTYFHPIGKKPIADIPIIFDDQIRTVAEFIADAGRQSGFRADVVFDVTAEPRPTIQVVYKGSIL